MRRTAVAKPSVLSNKQVPERAILVGAGIKGQHPLWELEDSLQELAQLAGTAGADVVGKFPQQLERLTHHYIGKGKLEEIKEKHKDLAYTLALFDDELTPTQQRNLEEALGVKVVDRSALILDIFARHAHTVEGRLQVELAQHEYLLPRLVGQWTHLERLGGGIGTRGPGETQLETDRRLVSKRISLLKEKLEQVRDRRNQQRERRKEAGVPVVALVGYTNAGKSTLFNALTRSSVEVENKLFSTLDPTTRRLRLPDERSILLSDTVGFINKLPKIVVAAFRATLEELEQADLLLHVVDINHRNAAEQAQVVDNTLKSLRIARKPRLLVLNKIDLLMGKENAATIDTLELEGFQTKDIRSVAVSAHQGWGLDRLLTTIGETLDEAAQQRVDRAEQEAAARAAR
ncbi:MAG: GTPase HflX [Dehalococcoidia bacterium]|nr:GTPase HflX [Dehalococcoidia bacterium]